MQTLKKSIYIYNKENGEKVKSIKGDRIILVTDKYLIYEKDDIMVCLNANTLEKLWESSPIERVTLYDDKLYGYKFMGSFTVMDVKTGEIIWQDKNNIDEDFASGTTPVVNDKYVVTITEYSDRYPECYIWVYKRK